MINKTPKYLLNNRFQILCYLAQGGFSQTYLAIDTFSDLQSNCVIKKFSPNACNQDFFSTALEQFKREADILKQLGEESSQIPKLYKYFEEDGNFYLALEYIPGSTIRETINQNGTCSESEVRKFLSGILPIIALVHQNKIIHRDIKPANIILRPPYSQPVLIDFGNIKQTFQTILSQSGVEPSVIITSEGFTSPEQATGREINYASDIYSLAMTAIFMVTGKEPNQFLEDSEGKILWQEHCVVSPQLSAILNRAIEFRPCNRYSSAQEMLAALDTEFAPNSSSPTTEKTIALNITPNTMMINNKSWLSKFGIVTFLAFLLGGGFTVLNWNQAEAKQKEKEYQEIITAVNEGDGDYEFCQTKAAEIVTTNSLFSQQAQDLSHNCSQINQAFALKNNGKLSQGIKTILQIPENSPVAPKAYQETADWINIPINAKSADIKQQLDQPIASKLDRNGWAKVWQETGYNIDPTQWINRQNTYQIVPNQITLNLVLDCPRRGRGTVHQVEYMFDSSVPLAQIEAVLARVTEEKNFADSQSKLRDIYNKKVQLREFNTGVLTGAIERDSQNRIHLYLRETNTLQ